MAGAPGNAADFTVPDGESLVAGVPEKEYSRLMPPPDPPEEEAKNEPPKLGETSSAKNVEPHSQSFVTRLKAVAAALWNEARRIAKLTALKMRLARLKGVDLKAAHYAFGKKCYELSLHKEKLATEFTSIGELQKQIAEKKAGKASEAQETNTQKAKRLFGNLTGRAAAYVLARRLKNMLIAFGQVVVSKGSSDVAQAELERVKMVQRQIAKSEDEHAALCKNNTGSQIHPVRYWAPVSLIVLICLSGTVSLITARFTKHSASAQAPDKKRRELHLSVDELEIMTRCKFQPAPASQGLGAKMCIHGTNRLILITNGPDANITSLKMCVIVGYDDAEMADSRLALKLFDGIVRMTCRPEASKWINGKLKAAIGKARDYEPPSRIFDGIAVDTHSKVGMGVGYSASDGKISEKTSELAFDVTISVPELH